MKTSYKINNITSEIKINTPAINYSDSYINNLIEKVTKTLNQNKEVFTKYYNTIYGTSIKDIIESQLRYEKLLENIESIEKLLESTVNKCDNVIQAYDYLNFPDNVEKLNKLSNNVHDLSWDFYNLKNALEAILEAGRQLAKGYYNK